jgi:hypothetical protein
MVSSTKSRIWLSLELVPNRLEGDSGNGERARVKVGRGLATHGDLGDGKRTPILT